jgi:hypothetical protein
MQVHGLQGSNRTALLAQWGTSARQTRTTVRPPVCKVGTPLAISLGAPSAQQVTSAPPPTRQARCVPMENTALRAPLPVPHAQLATSALHQTALLRCATSGLGPRRVKPFAPRVKRGTCATYEEPHPAQAGSLLAQTAAQTAQLATTAPLGQLSPIHAQSARTDSE